MRFNLSDRDRKLIRATALSALMQPLITVCALVTLGVCSRGLEPVRFGTLATIATLSALFAFGDLGFGTSLMTRLSGSLEARRGSESAVLVSSSFFVLCAIAVVIAAGSAAAIPYVPWPRLLGADLPAGTLESALAVFAGFRALAIPATIGQRVHYAAQLGGRANSWQLAGGLASVLGVLACARLNGSLAAYVLCLVGLPVLANLLETVSVFTYELPELRPRLRLVSAEAVIGLARLSGLFFVLSTAVAVAFQTDTLVTASILGAVSAGTFAVVARMFSAVSTLFAAMSTQLWSSTVAAIAAGDLAWVRTRCLFAVRGTLAVVLPLNLVLIFAGQPIARLWIGEEHVPPMSLLVAAGTWGVYSTLMQQMALVMNAFEVIRPQIIMAVLSAVANVGLSIILTRWVGITGPLLGSLIAHMVFAGGPAIWIVRKLLNGERTRVAQVEYAH